MNPLLEQLIMSFSNISKCNDFGIKLFCHFMWWHTECLDIIVCLLSLQCFDAWAPSVESICMQICYISHCVRCLLWNIYCFIRQTRWGRVSQNGSICFLVIVCAHLFVCVCVSLTGWQRMTRRSRLQLPWYSFIYSYNFCVQSYLLF